MKQAEHVTTLCAELVATAQNYGYGESTIQSLMSRIWTDMQAVENKPEPVKHVISMIN